MACENWKAKLDTYLDGELAEEEMRGFDTHVRGCQSCSADALARVQTKRGIQAAGKRFAPSAEFRKRIRQQVSPRPQRSFRFAWVFAAVAIVLTAGMLTSGYYSSRAPTDHLFSEIADLHVATLASSSPVDVVSTDRHTVKPWFQGRIPFAFNLPELQNTEFSLVGGRIAYLDQTPGAQLIYDIRKHHISVFIFQDRLLPAQLSSSWLPRRQQPFNLETWSEAGLRYFVIGDASSADIANLARLLKG